MPNHKQLFDMIENTQKLIQGHMPAVRSEIEQLIQNKEKSTKRIEFLLDSLLGYIGIGCGEKEFFALIDYYKTVSPEYATDYINIYKETYEEE